MYKNKPLAILEELADASQIKLFRDPCGTAYLQVPDTDGMTKIFCVRQEECRQFLIRKSFLNYGYIPKHTQVKECLDALEAFATEAETISTWTRVGGDQHRIYYDLADGSGQVVEITPSGWRMTHECGGVFLRYAVTAPQRLPAQEGVALDKIFNFVNVQDPAQQLLLKVAMVAQFIPEIAHPILSFCGNQGSAKSMSAKFIKRLVDPSNAEVGPFPSTTANLAQILGHSYLTVFDNLTALTEEQSNLLCQVVTGGSFYKRKMHTDEGEVIFNLKGNVILTSISQIIEKADLLDRALLFELPAIQEGQRQDETNLNAKFNEIRPGILGSIFSTLSKAMSLFPTITTSKSPRLADFYRWGLAIATALGHSPEEFAEAYKKNQDVGNAKAIDAEPVAEAVLDFVSRNAEWTGKVSTLHNILQRTPNAKLLPKTPNHLSRKLKELQLTLKNVGVHVTLGRFTDENVSKVMLKRIS